MKEMKSFKKLGLSDEILKVLIKKGFEEPTPIQKQCIPELLNNTSDIIGQAQTGTGKTAAFGLPILELLNTHIKETQAIILTPTRELAIQVAEEIYSLKGEKRISITAIYGGQSIEQQIRKLSKGVHIVVGTPGRVIDLINRKKLFLNKISFFILDEADEMLNMGFIEDVEYILQHTPDNKRTLFFSATIPERIVNLADKYMKQHKVIRIESKQRTTTQADQIYFEVRSNDKFDALTRIIDVEPEFYGLVFCRTKVNVDAVSRRLIERGYEAEGLHGDISQAQRERILTKFRNHAINVLVATDVASRGIDIIELTHVINYDLPQDPESYIHRIGRTGRAGKKGTAITFVTPSEYRQIFLIGRATRTKIRKELLPDIDKVLSTKKNNVKNLISKIIEKSKIQKNQSFTNFANELLSEYNTEDLVSSLLQLSFHDQLDESSYRRISEQPVDETGTTRLFIAKGKKSGMTPKKLISFISKGTDIDSSDIHNIKIFDNFSFISVPFKEAEIILQIFKKLGKGNRPIVVKAKEKTSQQ